MALRPSGGAIELVVGDSSSSDPTGVRALMPCSASNGVIPVSESVVHVCQYRHVQMKVLILRVSHLS